MPEISQGYGDTTAPSRSKLGGDAESDQTGPPPGRNFLLDVTLDADTCAVALAANSKAETESLQDHRSDGDQGSGSAAQPVMQETPAADGIAFPASRDGTLQQCLKGRADDLAELGRRAREATGGNTMRLAEVRGIAQDAEALKKDLCLDDSLLVDAGWPFESLQQIAGLLDCLDGWDRLLTAAQKMIGDEGPSLAAPVDVLDQLVATWISLKATQAELSGIELNLQMRARSASPMISALVDHVATESKTSTDQSSVQRFIQLVNNAQVRSVLQEEMGAYLPQAATMKDLKGCLAVDQEASLASPGDIVPNGLKGVTISDTPEPQPPSKAEIEQMRVQEMASALEMTMEVAEVDARAEEAPIAARMTGATMANSALDETMECGATADMAALEQASAALRQKMGALDKTMEQASAALETANSVHETDADLVDLVLAQVQEGKHMPKVDEDKCMPVSADRPVTDKIRGGAAEATGARDAKVSVHTEEPLRPRTQEAPRPHAQHKPVRSPQTRSSIMHETIAEEDEPLQLTDSYVCDEATKMRAENARILVEMGFKVGEAHNIVRESESLEEAVNKLIEKECPSPSVWETIVNWFTGDATGMYRPGKYQIVREGACVGACSGQPDAFKPGQVVDIVEIQLNDGLDIVRGRMPDGQWIKIASTYGAHTWALRVPLVPQLMQLGFTESQAEEAAKRCSTIEAAVEFLASKKESL